MKIPNTIVCTLLFFIICSCSKTKVNSIVGNWRLISIDGGIANIHQPQINSSTELLLKSDFTFSLFNFYNNDSKGVYSLSSNQKLLTLGSVIYNLDIPSQNDLFLSEYKISDPMTYHFHRE